MEAFEEATLIARRSQSPAAYRAALDLYGGELLPDDPYEEWAEARREALRVVLSPFQRHIYGPHIATARTQLSEEEVAVLVARGLTNHQIATELSISEHTAATHVARILKKSGFHSRVQVASLVIE